ncbi:MAG: ornithine--oxo-acid transaminase [Legionellales bacterium]|nr:ornithine--oxo-acid transaminase [Legionellales bacterium]
MMNFIEIENQFGAHHYKPLPVVLTKAQGIFAWDVQGKRYIDMMSAYSAVSHGHCNEELIKTLTAQAHQLNVISRAYYSDKLAPFLQKACTMMGFDMALPMNSGAEAVETALKAARKWAYTVKKIPGNTAEIIACQGNFHGRTISIVAMSSEPQYQAGFGPFPSGFKLIPYGDAEALRQAITPNTAAFLVEPIQGEGGIILPPPGFLQAAQQICRENNVLLICDEIQTGLGRTGKVLACQHENIIPDAVILGKALGGGMLPVSLFLAKREVMNVFTPGDHGSTFGGNPLASAVALRALELIEECQLCENAQIMGDYFIARLHSISRSPITQIRGKGLLIGLEIDPHIASGREFCLRLLEKGILSKETHDTVVRLAPPLIINEPQIDEAINLIREVIESF